MKTRVAITGMGVVSGIGNDVDKFWGQLSLGRSGIAPIEAIDRSLLRFAHGAEVKNFTPEEHIPQKELSQVDRFTQFALVAAKEAVESAGLDFSEDMRRRSGVVMGTSIGGEGAHDELLRLLYRENKTVIHPLTIPRIMPNAAASYISMTYGLTGPNFTLATACASSNHAIGHAFWLVRNGACDIVLAGGSETPFYYGHLKAWEAIRVVAPDTCRPFSKNRQGMILGEGSGVLVLENLDHALARGAKIYAEIIGFGMSSDAGHLTKPDPDGARRAMQSALDDADIAPEQIGYINAHGTATAANDVMETQAIRSVFGAHADRLAVSATKSMHGHALGAAGALEAVATVMALHKGLLPPTANYTEPDPECDLDVVPNTARPADIGYALSNAFAFGGLNAVLAFRKFDP